MTILFNNNKNKYIILEDEQSGIKSGITEIFKKINVLNMIDFKILKTAANKLKTISNKENVTAKDIKTAIADFHNETESLLTQIINNITELKKIKS
jgi:hypothetical protein